jgi:hypothetical protein
MFLSCICFLGMGQFSTFAFIGVEAACSRVVPNIDPCRSGADEAERGGDEARACRNSTLPGSVKPSAWPSPMWVGESLGQGQGACWKLAPIEPDFI